MKKTISIIMSVILIVSVFSLNAFATDDVEEYPVLNTKTYVFFENLEQVETASLKISKTEKIMSFIPVTFSFEGFFKNEKIAVNISLLGRRVNCILENGIIYGYYPSVPFLYFKIASPELENAFTTPYNFLDVVIIMLSGEVFYRGAYSKTYEETVGGKTYTVDEFSVNDYYINRYIFDGDNLVAIESKNKYDDSVTQRFDIEISYSVDDAVFEMPATSFFDITWLLYLM